VLKQFVKLRCSCFQLFVSYLVIVLLLLAPLFVVLLHARFDASLLFNKGFDFIFLFLNLADTLVKVLALALGPVQALTLQLFEDLKSLVERLYELVSYFVGGLVMGLHFHQLPLHVHDRERPARVGGLVRLRVAPLRLGSPRQKISYQRGSRRRGILACSMGLCAHLNQALESFVDRLNRGLQ
jgi:hypothetical protein